MKLALKDKIAMYEQVYFTYDKPVPFKGDLKIYPAKVEDYYNFYNIISCFTLDKKDDPTGIGFSMTDLAYTFYLCQQEGSPFKSQLIRGLELVFHIQNGLYCTNPECEDHKKIHSFSDLRLKVADVNQILLQKYGKNYENNLLAKKEKEEQMLQLQTCSTCNSPLFDVIEFARSDKGKPILRILGEDIKSSEYTELKKIYCYQNLSDYDDTYMDPELKAGLEEASRLKRGNTEQPTLERQMTCVSISTGYSYEYIQSLSLRKFNQILRVADAQLSYIACKIGEMGGLVTFKNPYPHWIYTKEDARKSLLENVMTIEQIESKIGDGSITQ